MNNKLHMTVFERVQAERDELRRQLTERDAIIADLRQKLAAVNLEVQQLRDGQGSATP